MVDISKKVNVIERVERYSIVYGPDFRTKLRGSNNVNLHLHKLLWDHIKPVMVTNGRIKAA